MTEAMAPPGASLLATRKGQLTLAFLLVVALLDFMGIAVVNEPPGGTPTEITGVAVADTVNDVTRFAASSDEETTFPA